MWGRRDMRWVVVTLGVAALFLAFVLAWAFARPAAEPSRSEGRAGDSAASGVEGPQLEAAAARRERRASSGPSAPQRAAPRRPGQPDVLDEDGFVPKEAQDVEIDLALFDGTELAVARAWGRGFEPPVVRPRVRVVPGGFVEIETRDPRSAVLRVFARLEEKDVPRLSVRVPRADDPRLADGLLVRVLDDETGEVVPRAYVEPAWKRRSSAASELPPGVLRVAPQALRGRYSGIQVTAPGCETTSVFPDDRHWAEWDRTGVLPIRVRVEESRGATLTLRLTGGDVPSWADAIVHYGNQGGGKEIARTDRVGTATVSRRGGRNLIHVEWEGAIVARFEVPPDDLEGVDTLDLPMPVLDRRVVEVRPLPKAPLAAVVVVGITVLAGRRQADGRWEWGRINEHLERYAVEPRLDEPAFYDLTVPRGPIVSLGLRRDPTSDDTWHYVRVPASDGRAPQVVELP